MMGCPHQHPQAWFTQLPNGHRSHHKAKSLLVEPGCTENNVFILESGRARIYLLGDGKEQTLGYLLAGSVYVTHTPVWVESIEPCTLKSWPLSQIKQLFAAHPELAGAALKEVGKLLSNAISLIEDFAFRPVQSRLARYLLSEYSLQQSQELRLPGTTEALASLLGTSRQTLSTLLNRMEKESLISRPERQIVVLHKPEQLVELSHRLSAS